MIAEDVVVLSLKNKSVSMLLIMMLSGLLISAAPHHIIPTKGLLTMYKAGDFGTMKMGNSSYSKIVGIGDLCIKTNVGSTVMLKDVQHVPNLRMNVFSTLTID